MLIVDRTSLSQGVGAQSEAAIQQIEEDLARMGAERERWKVFGK